MQDISLLMSFEWLKRA